MVELKNVTKAYGSHMILSDISHNFPCGKITTIIAPNGTGKTTLLGVISGLVLPDKGEVSVSRRGNPNIVLAGDKNLYMKATVRENLYYFGALCGMTKARTAERINYYKKYLPIYDEIKNQLVEKLSYGQKRLLAIFSGILTENHCVLLDEITEGLDMSHVVAVEQLLQACKQNRVVIVVSHDYDFIANVSDEIIYLKDSKFQEIQRKASLEEIKQTYVRIFEGKGIGREMNRKIKEQEDKGNIGNDRDLE